MNQELYFKINKLIGYIEGLLNDIKTTGKKIKELKKTVKESRITVTEVLEKQLGGVSLEQQINISEIPDEDWVFTARHILDEINSPFVIRNQYDVYFRDMIKHILNTDKDKIFENIKQSIDRMKNEKIEVYNIFVNYFSKYPLWGTCDPENGDYTTLELRADVLKHHVYDFLWLYKRTEDYLSKRTLAAILINWIDTQTESLRVVKSIYRDYFEPDIFPDNKNDVFVDIGAYIGDSILNYVQIYGTRYKKIYAYEISEGSCSELRKNIEQWELHDVDIIRKGVGALNTYMCVRNSNTDPSANSLSEKGDGEKAVQIVRLDDDVEDVPTFIKMDIEGAEQGAIKGAENIIRKYHPKLAVCTYHGYEDIWKIPSMIYEMYPEYKFYLRHYGGDLIPTEFVLLCKEK